MQQPVASRIPQGVGAVPPPGMDPRKGKLMCIKVRMLDDTVAVFHLGHKASGQALFDEVCRHLNLLESDYFGLEFVDGYGNRCWLDKDKSILRQITSSQSDARFFFAVKFYTPTPCELEEEYTRYLLALQVRRDLALGEFVCNENSAALLASFIVQAECGDFVREDYPDSSYLAGSVFVPHQPPGFHNKVMENHKKLVGMIPADADLALLETARRCDFYGIKLHHAKDIEGTDVTLAVAHMGIKVLHQLNCVSTFSWAKIRKMSFKRRNLILKLHPDSCQYYKDTIKFLFETRDECKNFWKKCVEHHTFFRCADQVETKKESRLLSKGSSFRYIGRTQKQLIDYVREHHKRREPFERPIRSSMSARPESARRIQFPVLDATQSADPLAYGSIQAEPRPQLVRASLERADGRGARPRSAQHQSAAGRGAERDQRACSTEYEQAAPAPPAHQAAAAAAAVQFQAAAAAAQPDPMSVSLPNVLGDDIKVICREFRVRVDQTAYPSKSVSGDNFLQGSRDNLSEGSYRMGEENRDSSQSDIITTCSAAADPRVYSTTFTTKRVGNVIVKKVKPAPKPASRNPLESSDDDSSYSEFRSAAAPGRHPACGSQAAQVRSGFARCRDVVPVPIDGPPAAPPATPTVHAAVSMFATSCSTACGTAPLPASTVAVASSAIIRPVLMEAGEPLRKPIFIKPVREGKPLVTPLSPQAARPSTFDPQARPGALPSVVAKSERSSFRAVASPEPGAEARKSPAHGAAGPLPGKIITRQNMCLTPHGIDVKPARPAVPPKPKQLQVGQPALTSLLELTEKVVDVRAVDENGRALSVENTTIFMGASASPNQPSKEAAQPASPKAEPANSDAPQSAVAVKEAVDEAKAEPVDGTSLRTVQEEADKLLAPLDSILHDANQLAFLSSGREGGEGRPADDNQPRPFPTLISVECEDRPDLKKLHLFNGDIPYTLHMRSVAQTPPSTSAAATDPAQPGSPDVRLRNKRPTEMGRHRKSIDLVHRNRLPSQDSFSSQDHSISPTTPEAGNVVEYVMRRRSVSTERRQACSSTPCARRFPPKERRRTQPVQFTRSESPDELRQTESSAGPSQSTVLHAPIARPDDTAGRSDGSTSSDPLPEPPPLITNNNNTNNNSSSNHGTPQPTAKPQVMPKPQLSPHSHAQPEPTPDSNASNSATQRKETGLLETDL